ncbi:MAG TPA: 1-deoxy-D-xylulose-5-phosphate synthase [Pirellulales bacterium]|jgi:1-deoxy-D-xylulose-5-phosphate synthase|nr:1-deoxy-D-xylulose-5-phosphate synthase [Pirellulales bacterium]
MNTLLSSIHSPHDLVQLTEAQLEQLAQEMREALCNLVSSRTAHFASNLGVVELCLALHTVFDFSRDRLIWDTGHQIYPHKLVTGRYEQFHTIRSKGGLMGYPNPQESPYDLFMTGHAGCSVSTALGLKSGDELLGHSERYSVAVIGDGAFPSGIVFEAMNNAAGLKKKLLVILNDNQMSICPRVGGLAAYLDHLRMNPSYSGLKHRVVSLLNKIPVLGDPVERLLGQIKDSLKAGLHGGMLFEELGFRYVGPVDGHNIAMLRRYLKMVKDVDGPVLLHVFTEKGHGFQPAAADPVYFHTPAPFERSAEKVIAIKSSTMKAYTDIASQAVYRQLEQNPRATVITAAMCQGNKLEAVRDAFPQRFFDVGICESHAVAFAAGQAKAGLRPIIDIYSTFLQRSYDQLFQEVALQNLPVTFLLDRAGLTGPDGPTHHGCFDLGYLRLLPNMLVLAPGDAVDLPPMLEFALSFPGPVAIRYPKATAEDAGTFCRAEISDRMPVELARGEVFEWGRDGIMLACGTLLTHCLNAAETLRAEGLDIGVVNMRFVKPLDTEVVSKALESSPFVLTVEEAALTGGFGSAVLETAADAGLNAAHVTRCGIPDRFIEHGERAELLASLGLDANGLARTCRELAQRAGVLGESANRAG